MAVDSAYNLGKAGNKKKYRVKKNTGSRVFEVRLRGRLLLRSW